VDKFVKRLEGKKKKKKKIGKKFFLFNKN